ncbi:MAG TPA: SLC13 family permease [Acidimicrobiales bacterium]|nr:SLC13 family permease [Acidimicrobiales bacterium]
MRRWRHVLGLAGGMAAVAAAALDPGAASAAAGQTWPAFVLVAGLLLVGLVAAGDHLFAAAGGRLAALAPGGTLLFAGVAGLVATVTAVLNLDTSVAFLSPVLVHTARKRGEDGVALLALCLLMSNAASLLLPGSNLTNLIVLGNHHMSGGTFFVRMALPWVGVVGVTAAVAGWAGRTTLRRRVFVDADPERPVMGAGLAAVVAVVVLVLAVGDPAPAVAAVGVAAGAYALTRRRIAPADVVRTLDLPVLLGLFGLAVALGALGRDWTGPADALRHLDPWGTAAMGAAATVLVNNLPASALLSARPPLHPLSLLVGLDLGPNLFVSGSLAWVLWYASARAAGGRPDVARTVRTGLVAAPLSMAVAVGALLLVSSVT